jgi:hypothetical protein
MPIGGVIFYEHDNFGGRQFSINEVVPNFVGSRFNDRAQSAIVEGGPWEICVDAEFRGDCRIFVPGRYPNLGGLGGRVSSARPSHEPRAGGPPVRGAPARRCSRDRISRGAHLRSAAKARAIWTTSSTTRRPRCEWIAAIGSFAVTPTSAANAGRSAPVSIRNLPPDLNNRVSSGRRISNEYPYNHNPNWR